MKRGMMYMLEAILAIFILFSFLVNIEKPITPQVSNVGNEPRLFEFATAATQILCNNQDLRAYLANDTLQFTNLTSYLPEDLGYAFYLFNQSGNLTDSFIIGERERDAETVGLWHFNENQGTQAKDYSGNGYHGTLAGTSLPQWDTGKLNYALNTTNAGTTNNGNRVTTSYRESMGSEGTIMFWLYINLSSEQYLISRGYDGYSLRILGQKTQLRDDNQYIAGNAPTSANVIPLNTWTHVAFTWGPTNGIRIFHNGVQEASASSATGELWAPRATDTNLTMMARAGTGNIENDNALQGKMDEVIFLSTELNSSLILEAYTSQTADTSGLGNETTASSSCIISGWLNPVPGLLTDHFTDNSQNNTLNNVTIDEFTTFNSSGGTQEESIALAGNIPETDANTITLLRLDETSGTTAFDETGTNNFTVTAPNRTNGRFNIALNFTNDGFNDGNARAYFEAARNLQTPLKNFTWAAWVYRTGASDDSPVLFEERQLSGGDNTLNVFLRALSTGVVQYIHSNCTNSYSSSVITSTGAIQTGAWAHLAFVRNGTNLKIYVNGVVKANSVIAADYCTTGTRRWNLGEGNWRNTDFQGIIDEVLIQNTAMSEQEIQALAAFNGTLLSKQISRQDANFTTIEITETDASGFLTIDIVNASDTSQVLVANVSNGTDISNANDNIIVRANFTSNGSYFPTLDYWAVSLDRQYFTYAPKKITGAFWNR